MPITFLKFLSGFNIFSGEKLVKLVFYFILIAAGIGIYHKAFIEPTIKNTQKTVIQRVERYYQTQDGSARDNNFLGVKIWRFKIGLGW